MNVIGSVFKTFEIKKIYIDFIKKSKYDYWININTLITIPLVFIGTVIMEIQIAYEASGAGFTENTTAGLTTLRDTILWKIVMSLEKITILTFLGFFFGIIRTIKKSYFAMSNKCWWLWASYGKIYKLLLNRHCSRGRQRQTMASIMPLK